MVLPRTSDANAKIKQLRREREVRGLTSPQF